MILLHRPFQPEIGRCSLEHLDRTCEKYGDMVLLYGGDPGIEMIAASWAEAPGVGQIIRRSDWNAHGKAAPFRRNDELLNLLAKGVIAFPASGSKRRLSLPDRAARPRPPSIVPGAWNLLRTANSLLAPLRAGRRGHEMQSGRLHVLPPPALLNGGVRLGGPNVEERFRRSGDRIRWVRSEGAASCGWRGKGAMTGKVAKRVGSACPADAGAPSRREGLRRSGPGPAPAQRSAQRSDRASRSRITMLVRNRGRSVRRPMRGNRLSSISSAMRSHDADPTAVDAHRRDAANSSAEVPPWHWKADRQKELAA